MLASIEPKLKVNTSTHTSSYAGGYPTFPSFPSASASSVPITTGITCGHCQASMPLLSQIYCPMEQGENDRTLYVWACPKADCQRRPGRCVLSTTLLALYPSLLYKPSSLCKHELIHNVPFMPDSLRLNTSSISSVRAFRASARNEVYAADAAEKRAKAEAEAKRLAEEEEKKREAAKVNPFAVSTPERWCVTPGLSQSCPIARGCHSRQRRGNRERLIRQCRLVRHDRHGVVESIQHRYCRRYGRLFELEHRPHIRISGCLEIQRSRSCNSGNIFRASLASLHSGPSD